MVTLKQLREKVFKVYAHGQFDPTDGVFEGDGLAKLSGTSWRMPLRQDLLIP